MLVHFEPLISYRNSRFFYTERYKTRSLYKLIMVGGLLSYSDEYVTFGPAGCFTVDLFKPIVLK